MNQSRYSLLLLIVLMVPTLRAEEPTSAELEFFEKKIRPVLVNNCHSCHSAEAKSVRGGLLLDTREGIRQGGESGHAVVPGNLDESLLIQAVKFEGLEMPPKKQLSENVIADLEKWVKMGAPDPRDGVSAPVRQTIDFERAREFWAFQPITAPSVPQPKDATWSDADIDHFVLEKLEAAGLQPSADAEPRILICRLYFDLIGLPPTPEQIEEYCQNPTQDMFLRITDRLLASNQFGERWGRHWLDVVRYAESTGMERNYTYPEAWRYRDYVIDSFNSDKPFDRFLTEQVAGDLLEFSNQLGQGIVRTVNNFGANGDRPSHPELLDYLASKLRTDGWSVKSLIRAIVASRTYRQTSVPNTVATNADPENRLLWRMNPRRLEAEAICDAVLAVSGTLDLAPGEKSIVTKVGDGDIGRNLKTEQFATHDNKRSVYLPIVRGVVPEMLQIFDFPEPSIIADSRDVTTVPTQALFMMNSPFVMEQSRKFADRLLTERVTDADRIQYGYQLALGRQASNDEVARSLAFIGQASKTAATENEQKQQPSKQKAWAGFCQVLLASAEFRYLE